MPAFKPYGDPCPNCERPGTHVVFQALLPTFKNRVLWEPHLYGVCIPCYAEQWDELNAERVGFRYFDAYNADGTQKPGWRDGKPSKPATVKRASKPKVVVS